MDKVWIKVYKVMVIYDILILDTLRLLKVKNSKIIEE